MSGTLVLHHPLGNFLESSTSHEHFSIVDTWLITLQGLECLILAFCLIITLNLSCAEIHFHLSDTFNEAVANCYQIFVKEIKKIVVLLQANLEVCTLSSASADIVSWSILLFYSACSCFCRKFLLEVLLASDLYPSCHSSACSVYSLNISGKVLVFHFTDY